MIEVEKLTKRYGDLAAVRDISFSGVSAVFPGSYEVRSQGSVLTIEDVALTVSPIESFGRGGETIVRFRVESILKSRDSGGSAPPTI